MERFVLSKNCTGQKWIITDTASDPCEDAVIYTFPTKAKAIAFKAMMIAEHNK